MQALLGAAPLSIRLLPSTRLRPATGGSIEHAGEDRSATLLAFDQMVTTWRWSVRGRLLIRAADPKRKFAQRTHAPRAEGCGRRADPGGGPIREGGVSAQPTHWAWAARRGGPAADVDAWWWRYGRVARCLVPRTEPQMRATNPCTPSGPMRIERDRRCRTRRIGTGRSAGARQVAETLRRSLGRGRMARSLSSGGQTRGSAQRGHAPRDGGGARGWRRWCGWPDRRAGLAQWRGPR